MRQVVVNNNRYTAINVNTDILLTDSNLELLYRNFRFARANGTFDDSFSEYCKFCFATGAGLYLLEASKMSVDKSAKAVRVYDDSLIKTDGELLLYES